MQVQFREEEAKKEKTMQTVAAKGLSSTRSRDRRMELVPRYHRTLEMAPTHQKQLDHGLTPRCQKTLGLVPRHLPRLETELRRHLILHVGTKAPY